MCVYNIFKQAGAGEQKSRAIYTIIWHESRIVCATNAYKARSSVVCNILPSSQTMLCIPAFILSTMQHFLG
jgi:hypothetical protein